jgi:hypothetical protein
LEENWLAAVNSLGNWQLILLFSVCIDFFSFSSSDLILLKKKLEKMRVKKRTT